MHPYLARTRLEQSQHLGRALTEVLVRLLRWVAFRLPTRTGLRYRLERPCFVLAPEIQAKLLAQRVGVLNQLFLGVLSGSVTATMPALRLRKTVPVWHQVRFSW